MTPIAALQDQAERNPERVALISNGEIWTYMRLFDAVQRLASGLIRREVQPGDRVALQMLNCVELVMGYHACFQIGAIAAPLLPGLNASEVERILARLKPSLYIGNEYSHDVLADLNEHIVLRQRRFVTGEGGTACAGSMQEIMQDGSRRSILVFSRDDYPVLLLPAPTDRSGMKMIVHTNDTLARMAETWEQMRFDSPDLPMNIATMSHSAGLFVMLASIRHGVPIRISSNLGAGIALPARGGSGQIVAPP